MFSASLELILNVAYREAASRRHTHLTLEHLLYALAHEPEGERILGACGADLPALRRTLDEFLGTLETFGRADRSREPAQTLAFRRVLQTAVLHVQSAGKDEVRSGDVLAAIVKQPKAYAAEVLEAQGVTRLDILNYISHGISKVPRITGDTNRRVPARSGRRRGGSRHGAGSLSAYTVNLSARARAGSSIPSSGGRPSCGAPWRSSAGAGRTTPVFVGEAGVGKTALREGWRRRLLEDDVPAPLAGAEGLLPRHDRAPRRNALPGRFRGTLQGGHHLPRRAAAADPLHRRGARTVGGRRHHGRHDGPGHPDQAGARRGRAARHRLDHVRTSSSTSRRTGRWPGGCRRSPSRSRPSTRRPGSWPGSARGTPRTTRCPTRTKR